VPAGLDHQAARAPGEVPPRVGPLFVRIPNWLGDLVLAFPVLEAAARGPAIFAGPESFRGLIEPRFPSVRYLAVSRARRWASVPAIRAAQPRAALLLTESLSSALLALFAGVPIRIGYDAEGRGSLLTRRVARAAARSIARAAEYRHLALAAGLDVEEGPPALAALPQEVAAGERLLAGAGRGGEAYAVLAPGAAYGPAKQWGAERFAEVAEHLASRHALEAVLVGAEADREAAAAVERLSGAGGVSAGGAAPARPRVMNLAGHTSLGELVGLLAGARSVVSNDSGVMHLAAALGRPTVAIFGSTSPVWTSASAPWVANLYAAYPCSPCYRRTCPIGYGCLKAVGTEEARSAVDRVMR
jgi:heptosyltransferase-2